MIDSRIFVDTVDRTFETRLQFIGEIFSALYDKSEILTSCINYKLGATYEQYIKELEQSEFGLSKKDPLKVLNKINKGGRGIQ